METLPTKYTQSDYTVTIDYDLEPMNPRDDCNLGTMLWWHRRYSSPDENPFRTPEDFFRAHSKSEIIVQRVYMYDHGVVVIHHESFHGKLPQGHAEFDSGVVGVIYTTKTKVKEWFGWERLTQKRSLQVYKHLISEIEAYNSYLNGTFYMFTVTDPEGKYVDGAGNYHDLEECRKDAQSAVPTAPWVPSAQLPLPGLEGF